MKPNYAGVIGWLLLLAAVVIPFVSPLGAINGRALAVFALACAGVVLIDRAWQAPSRNRLRSASARKPAAEVGPTPRLPDPSRGERFMW